MSNLSIKDHDYLQQAFMLSGVNINDGLKDRRKFQKSRNKFTDTTPGGNFWINPPPQWSPTCDIRSTRFFNDQFGGMGGDYSNAIDDNADVVYFRMGVPEFNGLFSFLTNMFDPTAAYLARTGRAPGWLFTIAEGISSIIHWPIQAISVTYTTLTWLQGIPKTKFYYSKNAMPLYWKSCNNMLNQILVNMGMIPPAFRTYHQTAKEATYDFDMYTDAQRKQMANMLPGLWKADGSVDLYYLANRANRKYIRWQKALNQKVESASVVNRTSAVQAIYEHGNNWKDPAGDSSDSNIKTYLQSYFDTGLGQGTFDKSPGVEPTGGYTVDKDGDTGVTAPTATGDQASVTSIETPLTYASSVLTHLESELRDGGSFIGFKVNHNGSLSESFSNSFGENKLAGFLNGTSSATQEAKFSVAGGKTGIAPIDAVIGGVTDVLQGYAAGTGLSGLVNIFLGQGFVEIPKHWIGSDASLPRETYTVNLRSPYGNPVSRIQNLIIPLVCLLNMALAHAAGPQAHTSPFLVEAYAKGRSQIRLGMIDSMTITRGVGNVGWTQSKEALGIDVSWSVADLSPMFAIPIDPALSPADLVNPARAAMKLMGDETPYSDYMAILAALGVNDQIYRSEQLARVLAKTNVDIKQWVSPTQFAANFSQSLAGKLMSAFMLGTPVN